MKDSEFYTCEFCYKKFKPKRRRVQKYCSNTCRSKACIERSNNYKPSKDIEKFKAHIIENQNETKQKVDTVSIAGVGNAAIGTLAADFVKNVATPSYLKSATKGDINLLLEKLSARYLPIKNMPQNSKGEYPYYDYVEEVITYFKFQ